MIGCSGDDLTNQNHVQMYAEVCGGTQRYVEVCRGALDFQMPGYDWT